MVCLISISTSSAALWWKFGWGVRKKKCRTQNENIHTIVPFVPWLCVDLLCGKNCGSTEPLSVQGKPKVNSAILEYLV